MAEQTFKEFLKNLEKKLIPLSRECNESYFNATISGKDEDYKKTEECQIKLEHIFADREKFKYLESIKGESKKFPELEKRQYDKLYNAFLANQIDEKLLDELIKTQTEVEKKFATYRAQIDGKKVTDNEIDDILATTDDGKRAQAAWLASKKVGEEVAGLVKKLVDLRNESARQIGFKNFHEMSLTLSDQPPKEIEKIFDELDVLTAKPYAELKNEIDEHVAKKFKIDKKDVMPWHLMDRFLQRAPKIYEVNLDKFFTKQNVVEITEKYYDKIGLPVGDIIRNSDLYEKEGKYQHAYCLDIDRSGDVRMVCNVKQNQRWMATMLHECGHAAYDKYIDSNLPWFLRMPAHIFTTEAIAMLVERAAMDPNWIKEMTGTEEDISIVAGECKKTQRLEKLIFSRWSQVMYRFEKAMYENPEQDLNELWWKLVEKYQLIRKPVGRDKPDWASKVHIATAPVYYHNYELGELFASQLKNYIDKNTSNEKEMGQYLRENVFFPGKRYEWDEMIERATGEKLTAKYFAKEFVNE